MATGADGLRIGVRVPQYGSSWQDIRDFAQRAEERGFDGVWVNDHLQSPGRRKRESAFDALTTLSALAALTDRVRLGTVVLSASYRPPHLAAKMATIIDVISDGRLVLGVGTGSDVPEHHAFRMPFLARPERTARLAETIGTLRGMFSDPDGAPPNHPPPAQPGGPPIWLAAHGPRLLKMAGESADGIVAAFVGPHEAGRRLATAQAARPEGMPPLSCALYTFALATPSRGEARSWVAAEAESLGTTPDAFLRWLSGTGIVAEPDRLRADLAAHRAAGVTDAILVLPSRVPPEALDALAEAVLPASGA